jgi:hypothetical protein
MPPVLHLVFLVFAFVAFVIAAWTAPAAPDYVFWRRLVAAGLAALVASMISW